MWFETLANNKTPAINGEKHFSLTAFRRVRGHLPRRGPGPPVVVTARAGRLPSRLHGRRDRTMLRL